MKISPVIVALVSSLVVDLTVVAPSAQAALVKESEQESVEIVCIALTHQESLPVAVRVKYIATETTPLRFEVQATLRGEQESAPTRTGVIGFIPLGSDLDKQKNPHQQLPTLLAVLPMVGLPKLSSDARLLLPFGNLSFSQIRRVILVHKNGEEKQLYSCGQAKYSI